MVNRTEQDIMKNWGTIVPPVVSVCCTTYNHENYISEAIDGFLIQETNFPFEIIIRDDCSTDKTAMIVRAYTEKYPKIIKPIYETENQYSKGVRPMPVVFKKAVGKYFALCEGDDYWTDPLKLQKQVDFMEENDECSMCFHNVQIINENKLANSSFYDHLETKEYSVEEVLTKWTVPTCSTIFRAEISKKIPLNSNFKVGDNVLFTTCAMYGKLFCINEEMGVYRKSASGTSTSISTKDLIIHCEAMKSSFPTISSRVFDKVAIDLYVTLSKINLRTLNIEFFNVFYKALTTYKWKYLIAFSVYFFKMTVNKISKKFK